MSFPNGTDKVPRGCLPTPIKAEIIEESDGNKYLNLNAVTEADEIESIYVLNTPLNVGKLEAGFEFSPARSGAGSWEFFEVNNAEYSGRADVENRGRTVYWSQEIAKASKIQEDTIHFKNPVRNAKGRYSLHYELSRMSPDDAWEVKIFDVAQVTPTLLYSGTYPKTFGAITQIELVRFYAGVGGWPIDLDNYYVKTTAFPEVTDDSECASLGSNVEKFTLGFNALLPNPDDEVILVNATDENAAPITTKTNYDEETGRLEIMPDDLLDYATTYKVVFAGGDVSTYSFSTVRKPIRVLSSNLSYSDGTNTLEEIPTSGTFNATCSVTAQAYAADKQIVVIATAYNEAGEVIKYALTKQPLTQGRPINTTATLTGLQGGKVADVKAIIWEYKEGVGYRPIK